MSSHRNPPGSRGPDEPQDTQGSALHEAGLARVAARYGEPISGALDGVRRSLGSRGLNLFHCWLSADTDEISPAWQPFAKSDGTRGEGILLVIGNAGQHFWPALSKHYREHSVQDPDTDLVDALQSGAGGPNPVDSFALQSVKDALHEKLEPWLDSAMVTLDFLYPLPPVPDDSIQHAPLQKLGAAAGWYQPSPLGTGIHPDWGLWYAYRALVQLIFSDELVATFEEARSESAPSAAEPGFNAPVRTDICANCVTRDCISHCPGQALVFDQSPDMQACVTYRRASDSGCADRCLAREACPVNQDRQYTRDQISYHYRVALTSLLKYFP